MVGLTKTIALETAREKNVTCNSICPGWVLTPLVEEQVRARMAETGNSFDEESRLLLREKQPSEEFVLPEHLGDLALFLCTPAAAQVTGEALSMDGGWTIQ